MRVAFGTGVNLRGKRRLARAVELGELELGALDLGTLDLGTVKLRTVKLRTVKLRTVKTTTVKTTTMRIGTNILAGLVVLLLLAAACELKVAEEGQGPAQDFGCATDGDCPDGDECVPEIGACVSAGTNDLEVAVQLTPPPGAPYATTQYVDFSLAEAGALDLALPAPRRVRGWVRTDRNPLERNTAATVTARAPGDIPGTEYRFAATSRKDLPDDAQSGYELLLAPTSQYYQVTVALENDDFPPYNLPPRQFGTEEEWLDLVVPALADYHRISGRLVTDEAADTALSYVRVAAFSETTANVSTVSEVSADGSFELSVPPEPAYETYRIVVEPTDRTVALPKMTLVEALFVDADVDLGVLALGDLPAPIVQDVLVTGPGGAPASGVTVRCRGTVLDGVLTDEGITGEDGVVSLYLRRGSFDCTCLPPAGSNAAAALWAGEVVSEGERWELTLGEKVRVEGVVSDHSAMRVVPGVIVIAVHTDSDDPLHGREVEATTDERGRFVLQIEPATYAFILRPPEGSGLPVRVVEGVAVTGAVTLDLPLPRATLVTGTVRGAEGEPLGGVRVDFYQLTDGAPDGLPGEGAGGATGDAAIAGVTPFRVSRDRTPDTSYERLVRIVGSAVTDETGIYRALLPKP